MIEKIIQNIIVFALYLVDNPKKLKANV